MRFLLDSARPDPEAEEEALAYLLRQRGKTLHSDELRDMLFEAFVREAVECFCKGERTQAVDKLTEAQDLYWPAGASDRIDPLERWIKSCVNFATATHPEEEILWIGWDAHSRSFMAQAMTAPLRRRVGYAEEARSIFQAEPISIGHHIDGEAGSISFDAEYDSHSSNSLPEPGEIITVQMRVGEPNANGRVYDHEAIGEAWREYLQSEWENFNENRGTDENRDTDPESE